MSVTAPAGFRAAGVTAGIKESGQPDVAVVINDGPSHAAAGGFTPNRVKAAPVLWAEQGLKGGRGRGVGVHPGGAHAGTRPGRFGGTPHTAPGPGPAVCGAVATTFERLDTDGCMSTNDTVLLLASGAAGVRPDPEKFAALLTQGCADLARQLQLDAEGAGKAIDIEVTGAASESDAVAVGRAVARCSLLKCAIGGEDPNWGRVLAAVGTTDATFEPDRLNVAINGIWVCRTRRAAEDRARVDPTPL